MDKRLLFNRWNQICSNGCFHWIIISCQRVRWNFIPVRIIGYYLSSYIFYFTLCYSWIFGVCDRFSTTLCIWKIPPLLTLFQNLQSFFCLPEVSTIELWDQINPSQYNERFSVPFCQYTQERIWWEYSLDRIGKVTNELICFNCEGQILLNTKEYRMMELQTVYNKFPLK